MLSIPKTLELGYRERSVRENGDRNERDGERVISSRAGESRGRRKNEEGALGRRRCCGGDGEIQKVDHGPSSKLELSFEGGERNEKRQQRGSEIEIGGEIKLKKYIYINLAFS